MEKLQAALEKARSQRNTAEPRPTQVAGTTLEVEAPRTGADTVWASLRPFTPDRRHLVKNRIVAFHGAKEATSFDILRTKALQMMAANGWKRLAITSPGAGSGKTTLTANLAASITRHPEVSAILMDMDMRRPSLGAIFGLPGASAGAMGTSDVLERQVGFAEQAWRIGDNLAVSANIAALTNSAEVLHSRRAAQVIDDIQEIYEPSLMIFDMPPMMVSDDTIGFMRTVDCVLLVAEYGVSTLDQIDLCERNLAERTNVLGVVLNKSRFNEEQYGYGEGYY